MNDSRERVPQPAPPFPGHAPAQMEDLAALGRIEAFRSAATRLRELFADLPLWLPAARLVPQADAAIQAMDAVEARMDKPLVITIIGPSGAGKSTLLNALCGRDDLSPAGVDRPTTSAPLIFCHRPEQARHATAGLDPGAFVLRAEPDVPFLEDVVLIDTPDTDSTRQDAHVPLLQAVVKQSDILLCVFDGQNPKRRDHIDLMKPFVNLFDGRSLVVVLNKSDRLDRRELAEEIVPEFDSQLRRSWDTDFEEVFALSARSHLQDPAWDAGAAPRHDTDRFASLREMLCGPLRSRPSVTARRLENARALYRFLVEDAGGQIEQDRDVLQEARRRLLEAQEKALRQAAGEIADRGSARPAGVNVWLYQKMAQRWVGPVGWMIALWARILLFGAGITAVFRFGNPLRQTVGWIASMLRYREVRRGMNETGESRRIAAAMNTFQLAVLRYWPEIAQLLVRGRFDPVVRYLEKIQESGDDMSEHLEQAWSDTLDREIEARARAFSHFLLQALLNAPILALLGYVGWLTTTRFLAGAYFSSDFFLHAFIALFIISILIFFLLQIMVRLAASPEKISRRALHRIRADLEDTGHLSANQVNRHLDHLLSLDCKSMLRAADD